MRKGYHKQKMNYSEEIDKVLNNELNVLIEMVKKKKIAFDEEVIKEYYNKYEMLKK